MSHKGFISEFSGLPKCSSQKTSAPEICPFPLQQWSTAGKCPLQGRRHSWTIVPCRSHRFDTCSYALSHARSDSTEARWSWNELDAAAAKQLPCNLWPHRSPLARECLHLDERPACSHGATCQASMLWDWQEPNLFLQCTCKLLHRHRPQIELPS